MVRKTKEELKAEQEELKARAMAIEVAQYPDRLMSVLEWARELNFELEVRNRVFELRDRDVRRPETVFFTMTHNSDNQRALENLEWDLRIKADEQAERERQEQVRKDALAKLTQEEKELLNLN